MTQSTHQTSDLEYISFLLLLAGVTILLAWIAWPFFNPLLWAALAAIMFQPLYQSILRRVGDKHPNLAASISLLIIFFAVLVPALWLFSLVLEQAVALVNNLRANPPDFAAMANDGFALLPSSLQAAIEDAGLTDVNVMQGRLQGFIGTSAGFIASQAVAFGGSAVGFFFAFSVALYVIFFLLRDGKRMGETIVHSLPLERSISERLAERFLGIVRATIKGSGVVGLVQGALGAITFFIAGVPSALVFGVLMAIFSLVPVIGTVVVWGPVGIYLLTIGDIWQGLFVLGSGFFIVSSADNVLRPILVGRDTGIPDWIILITTLGGISLAGFSGIVLGPLVAGLFLASWSILQEQRAESEEAAERYRTKVDVDGKARPDGKAAPADASDTDSEMA